MLANRAASLSYRAMTDAETEPQHGLNQESTGQGPVLEGARVRIEPISHERALALLAGRHEPELAWEEGFPQPPLLASLQRVIDDPDGPVWFGRFYAYVIVRRADGLAVGDAGFFGPPGADGEVEIGYALAPRARGAGLASEAVALLADWALVQPGVRVLTARVEADNAASVRLLDRLGFVADGRSEPYLRYVLRGDRSASRRD
jgi:RimJ/RimL family protein N-acetyltransferase